MIVLMRVFFGMAVFCGSISVMAGQLNAESYYGNYNPEHLGAVERHHLQQGWDKAKWDNPIHAWRDVEFILRHFPNHPGALMLAIDLSLKSEKLYTPALELFEKAVAFDVNPAPPWVIFGIFYHRHGMLDKAVTCYLEALKRDPTLAEAQYNLGLAYLDLKQYEKANRAAQKAYALGHPLPGLRKRLQEAGKWQVVPDSAQDAP